MIAGVGEGETFQFLGRNSGRSDSTPPQTSSQTAREVSIPRSEFWSFGPGAAAYAAQSLVSGFNSSVGILVVRTIGLIEVEISNSSVFQFLGRNSGRSDAGEARPIAADEASFNSSVGILVVRTGSGWRRGDRAGRVSIPRSEFWSFGPGYDCA